jgi:hypothetical protein
MPLSTEEYDKLSTEEREAYDASERQREREEQAGQSLFTPTGKLSQVLKYCSISDLKPCHIRGRSSYRTSTWSSLFPKELEPVISLSR